MVATKQRYPIREMADKFGDPICDGGDKSNVSKEARKNRVLAFLVDVRLALPRKVLFRNLRYRGADFSEGSIKNYLKELREDGLVTRIDADAFAEGQVKESNEDPGYWIPTNEGAEYIESVRKSKPDDIDTSHL